MTNILMKWTPADTVECYKQGWGPFTMDDGSVEILKLDDPDAVAADHNFAPFSGRRFRTDAGATAYVKRQAKRGDTLCQRALDLVREMETENDTTNG